MVKLANPVLQGVDGHDTQDVFGRRAAKEDLNKCDNLQGFPQSHGMRQDTTKPDRRVKLSQRFNDVVIEKPYSSNLQREMYKS